MRTVLVAAFLAFVSLTNASAQQAPARPPDGTYVYTWSQGGAVAGKSTITIQTRGATVTMQADTNLPGVQLSGGTVVFGNKLLEFQSYGGYATANGANSSIDLKLVNGAVLGTIKTQTVTNNVNVSQLAAVNAVAVDDGTMGTFFMLPAQLSARGANSFQLIPIVSGIAGFVTFTTSTTGPYPYGVPTTDVVGNAGGNLTLWYNPATFVVDQFARGPLVATLVNRH